MYKGLFSHEDVTIQHGSQFQSFYVLKDWLENKTFLMKEGGGDLCKYHIHLEVSEGVGMPDVGGGSYCNGMTVHQASSLPTCIAPVQWGDMRYNHVPPETVRDLDYLQSTFIVFFSLLCSPSASVRPSCMCQGCCSSKICRRCNETVHGFSYTPNLSILSFFRYTNI